MLCRERKNLWTQPQQCGQPLHLNSLHCQPGYKALHSGSSRIPLAGRNGPGSRLYVRPCLIPGARNFFKIAARKISNIARNFENWQVWRILYPAQESPSPRPTGAKGTLRPSKGLAKLDEWANMKELHPSVHVVSSAKEAHRVAALLTGLARQDPQLVLGADTEVAFIDIRKESPCAKGKVICISLYCGESSGGQPLDFAPGGTLPGASRRNMLWIETHLDDEVGGRP